MAMAYFMFCIYLHVFASFSIEMTISCETGVPIKSLSVGEIFCYLVCLLLCINQEKLVCLRVLHLLSKQKAVTEKMPAEL